MAMEAMESGSSAFREAPMGRELPPDGAEPCSALPVAPAYNMQSCMDMLQVPKWRHRRKGLGEVNGESYNVRQAVLRCTELALTACAADGKQASPLPHDFGHCR